METKVKEPTELNLLREDYVHQLNMEMVNYQVTRNKGSTNWFKDLDQHIMKIAHLKLAIQEVNDQLATIQAQDATDESTTTDEVTTDDS